MSKGTRTRYETTATVKPNARERTEMRDLIRIRTGGFWLSTATFNLAAPRFYPRVILSKAKDLDLILKANSGEILRLRLRMTSRLFLPQRAEQFSQLALDFQDRRKGLIGFQYDRGLLALDSLGNVADRVSTHLHGLSLGRVSDLLTFGRSHPPG